MSDVKTNDEGELFGALAAFLGGYRPLDGVIDEMVDASGALRPHWRGFVEAMGRVGPTEMTRRFGAVARHLKEAGVFYRVYESGEGAERAWPLSNVPVLISAEEWKTLSAGLIQRARLLDAMLADSYGQQKLVRDGVLPAAVVAGSPEFLRPMMNVTPKGGKFLNIYAADLGRGPDGRWWVIGDRAQAPSGAGYALENRIALSRAMPDVFREIDVERLAGFFAAMRTRLAGLSEPGSAGVCVLTPGPLNETYFEHAYLARYLGFLLVEGEDLVVRGDELFLRTVAGLRKADVLLRRLDSDFADPLELNAASRIGAPGLVRAARAGNVAMANALGSGLVEARALMGFLPGAARAALGEELLLPNTATWWCGQQRAREEVLDRFDEMMIAPAFAATEPGLFENGAVVGRSLSAAKKEKLKDAINRRGIDYVGQEVVTLSTAPMWRGGRFAPRPVMVRMFVAATDDGWCVMPGGFSRVSDDPDARAITMQRGGLSADVWVLGDGPVEQTTLLPSADQVRIVRRVGDLTSRTADNLFWLGRYVERAEAVLRLVRAIAGRAGERDRATRRINERLINLLVSWGAAAPGKLTPAEAVYAALGDTALAGAIPSNAHAARQCASVIRDRLSPDAWRTINDLTALADEPVPVTEADALDRADRALKILAAFSGFAQENMTRIIGWRFLEMGRRIERGLATARYVRAIDNGEASSLDALLELGDSKITFTQRYFLTDSRAAVVDLLVLDANNPRSCAFQVDRLAEHVLRLPGSAPGDVPSPAVRAVSRLKADLTDVDAASIDGDFLQRSVTALMALSDEISERYLINRGRLAGENARA